MKYWTIKAPDGSLWRAYIHEKRKDAISDAVWGLGDDWPVLYRSGYRCVRVTIQEVA